MQKHLLMLAVAAAFPAAALAQTSVNVYGSIDAIPAKASDWDVKGVSGAVRLAAVLVEQHEAAMLYRTLARLRLDAPLPQRTAGELEWRGAPRDAWEAFCDRWGLDRLRARPHRWMAG